VLQVQGKIDENESQLAEMEEEIENLRLSNGKLENRNDLLVRRRGPHSQLGFAYLSQAVASGSMTSRTLQRRPSKRRDEQLWAGSCAQLAC